MSSVPTPTPEAIASVTALYNHVRDKSSPLHITFEERYHAWRQTWHNPVRGEEDFVKLTSMGVKILPLVVFKLCDSSEIKAIKLYNAIEKDISFQSPSAATIITSNCQRNQRFSELSAGWTQHKDVPFGHNSVAEALDCEEYENLVNLGPSIVAHVMLAYYDDYGGWWDELLCELITGHQSGATVYLREDLHNRWIDWFENQDGEANAPYKLTGESARVERFLREGGLGHPYAELA